MGTSLCYLGDFVYMIHASNFGRGPGPSVFHTHDPHLPLVRTHVLTHVASNLELRNTIRKAWGAIIVK
jgi:hypothetical protein